MQCPYCQTMNPAQARFCMGCGQPLINAIVCPACHTLLPVNARYCFHCGALQVGSLAAPVYIGPQAVSLPVAPQQAPPPPVQAVTAPVQAVVPLPQPPVSAPAEVQNAETGPSGGSTPPGSRLPEPRPLAEMLSSLQRYLPQTLYEPLERRPTDKQLTLVRDHLSALLNTIKTYLPSPVILSPQPAGVPAGGMYRGVFLFGDVSGFTPLSERLKRMGQAGAERIADIINELFFDLVSVLHQHGGTLLKFGGDALLGLFPAETDEEMAQAALCAVQAALTMQAGMEKFAAIDAAGEISALRIKCGVSAGPYFAAHIGTKPDLGRGQNGLMAYVTTGHTVNDAEQAEGHANPGHVVITHSTYELIQDKIEVSPVEKEPPGEGFHRLISAPAFEGENTRLNIAEPPAGDTLAQITYLIQRIDLLAPYLADELIARIVTNPGDARITPDYRPVTVMFANYVGMSDLINALGNTHAEMITRHLNNYFVHMAEVVERYEGTLARMDQYAVGDRLVIFFGAPRAHEDDPARAVYTALEMQEAVRKNFSALQTPEGIFRFRQRIGINTGFLFAGNAGAPNLRQEYTLMGDDINMAARLMSKSGWQEIFISKKTQERVHQQFVLKDRGELKVKGKEILIQTYEVSAKRGLNAPPSPEDKEADNVAPLTGRDREFQTLQKCLQGLQNGRGQIITLISDSGLGKTRLLQETHQWLAARPEPGNIRWLECRALSFSEQVSYFLVIQMLRDVLNLKSDTSEDDVLFMLWEMGEQLLGKETAREAIPFLAHLLGLKLEGDWAKWVKDLDPKVRQKQTFWAARAFFSAVAQQQPIFITLDDLHFADDASLSLLIDLLEITTAAPIVFCFVFRPQREKGCWRLRDRAANTFPHRYTEISLQPLSAEHSQTVLTALLPGAAFTAQTLQEIFDKTAGNPFYLGEVVRSLKETGAVLKDQNGTYKVAANIDKIVVPDTLQSAIIARVDRLTEDARMALQMAAVIGRRFKLEILSSLNLAEVELGSWLAQLERSDLIRPEDVTDAAYIFPDALVQEVAYGNLLMQRRQEFHRQVGEILERMFTAHDSIEQECELLAYHFGNSNHLEKANLYLEMAGKKARNAYALKIALEQYTRLFEVKKKLNDSRGQAMVLYTLGVIAYEMGDYPTARQSLQSAMPLWQTLQDSPNEGWSIMYLGMIDLKQGNYALSSQHHQHALELARQRGDTLQEGIHLTNLARVSMRMGKYELALEQFQRSQELKAQVKDLKGLAFSRFYIGLTRIYLSQYGEAEEELQQALTQWQEQVKDKRGTSYCLYGLGLLALYREEYSLARDYFQKAHEIHAALVLNAEIIESLSFLAQAYLGLGELEQALKTSQEALARLSEQKDVEEVQVIYFNHYRVLLAHQDPAAENLLQNAYDTVLTQANHLPDAQDRQIYLEKVEVNRQIIAIVQGNTVE